MITIHNLRNEKPCHTYDIKVDRSSVLGNLYHMKSESERDMVCDKYAKNFSEFCENPRFKAELIRLLTMYRKGKKLRLFCWCAPLRCHAETIRDYIFNQESV